MLSDIMNVQIKRNKVTLFVLTDDINEALINRLNKKITIVRLHRKIGSFNYFPYFYLNLKINFGGFDLVHIHEKNIWNQLFIAPWINIYQTVHNTGLYSENFKRCKKIFSISKCVQNGLIKKGYSNVVLAPNGIDISIIKRKKSFNTNIDKLFRMVQVSRLIIEHKGQDLLLNAMHKLKKEGKLPQNMVVDFIGEGCDRKVLEEMTLGCQLEKHVNFMGQKNRDYVYNHLCDYDLFVQPSRYEGFGLTVAEALAANVPVLVSKNEGPEEIVDYGRCGFLFENGNVDDLAEKLLYIYNNYSSAVKKTELGKEFVCDNYNVERTANIYNKYYID